MEERRRRILRVTRQIIASGGEAELTIGRLCEQADVSQKTIYSAFGDREGVIRAALFEHMETIASFLAVAPPPDDTPGVLREFDWVIAELFRGPEFARTIIPFYFAAVPQTEAIISLRSVPRGRMERWLRRTRQRGDLVEGLNEGRIVDVYVDGEYAVLQRWASGRIDNSDMGDEMKANFLQNAVMVMRGEERDRTLDLLTAIHARLPGRGGAS